MQAVQPARLPPVGRIARRPRAAWLGAAVDGAEHLAVTLVLGFLVFSAGALALAASGWFYPYPLTAAFLLAMTGAAGLALPARLRSRGLVPSLAVASIVTLAGLLALPPAAPILGDPTGITFLTGAELARSGGFEHPDSYLSTRVPEARAAVLAAADGQHSVVHPGFYLLDGSANVAPRFPMLLSVWAGIGVLAAGPTGGLLVAPFLGAATLALFFLLARRAFGGRVAVLATLLLGTNGVQLWHSTLVVSEVLLQAMLCGALLAGLLALREPRPLYALTAGLAFGLLPLVKVEAAVVAPIGAVVLALAFAGRGSAAPRLFLVSAAIGFALSAAHYRTSAWPYFTSAIAAGPRYLALAAAVPVLGAVAAWLLHGKQRSPSEFSPPAAVLWAVTPLAVLVWIVFAALDGHPLAPFEALGAIWLGSYLSLWDTAVIVVGLIAVLSGGIPRVRRAEPAVVLATFAIASALYLGIFALYVSARDHLPLFMWETRRLLPTFIPLLALLEAAALVRWLRALPGGRGPVLLAAAVALTLARVPDALPLAAHREHAGALEQVAAIADRLEHNAVVVYDADDLGTSLAAPLRALFGRDGYIVWNPAAEAVLRGLLADAQRDGRPVYYITDAQGPETLVWLRGSSGEPSLHQIDVPQLERVSAGRPQRWERFTASVEVHRIGPLPER